MLNIERGFDHLNVSYIDSSQNVSIMRIPIEKHQMWNYKICQPHEVGAVLGRTNWDNQPIRKQGIASPKDFDKFRIEEILLNLPEESRYNLFKYVHPKKYFIDIEIEIQDEFPKAEEAKYPISTIAIANEKNVIIVLGTKKLQPQDIDFINSKIKESIGHLNKEFSFRYDYYETEGAMMSVFVNNLLPRFPFITGWNFTGFDWLYITNRCKRLGIDIAQGSIVKKTFKNNLLMHKLIVDYLDIYVKWDRVVAMKEQNNLDWVAKTVLGVTKIKYSGSLKELFENDYPLYVAYNAVDALLVRFLDEKLNTMSTMLKLSSVSQVETHKVFSPVWISDALCFREFYKRNKYIVAPERDESNFNNSSEEKDYEGAFVKQPIPGIYEWVCCFDFASLYPSLIRQFNISPDAYLGRSFSKETSLKEVETVIGTRFDNSFDSVFRIVLDDFYNRRKVAKDTAKELELKIEALQKRQLALAK